MRTGWTMINLIRDLIGVFSWWSSYALLEGIIIK
jgi:hypothetical protein